MSQNPELTDVEKLTALDMYLKALKPHGDALRVKVTEQMAADRDERKGAYLPDGTKIGTVTYRKGAVSARITDERAALCWVVAKHPEQVMQVIRPAFLTMLLDVAKKDGVPGACGYDPLDGEALPWIEIVQGNPGVTVTTTSEGKARMAEIAGGFAGMLARGRE